MQPATTKKQPDRPAQEPDSVPEKAESARILKRLADRVGPKNYENWFLGRCTVTVEGDEVRFGVGSPFVVSWMQRQFREAMQGTATDVLGPSARVRLDVDPDSVTREWYANAKAEIGHQEGDVFTPRVYGNATIRIPDIPVTVGESWTSRWTTTRKQKDNGGQFRLVQKATLLKVETRNGREIAFIDAKMTGTLHAPKEKKNPGEEKWTKTEGWMKLELEIETGRVLRSKGDGKVHNYYKGTDPGTGKESKLDLIFRSWGDYRGKNAERRSPSREKDY